MNTMDRGNIERPFPSFPQLKLAIVMNLDHLRTRMAQFVAEVAPNDPTAYTVPFETYLQWEQRQQQENINAKK
jgi:hypothetical protein